VKFVEHRIADRRVVRLIQKWLKAGVLEEGKRVHSEVGTVQGGSISPLLSNLYLHYVLDLWVQRWRRKQARGEIIFVRFADDFVTGFQHRYEAERFLAELRERFARFGLQLHADKTRIVEFGRYADQNRRNRGDGKSETFNFLGFTHSCGQTRKGHFTVLRQTMRQRWQAKLWALKEALRRRMHTPIREQGAYLRSALLGHFRYYGVPMNGPALCAFRRAVGYLWRTVLRRRSQGNHLPWRRIEAPYCAMVSAGSCLSSLSSRALGRLHPRWEPDAVTPPVRICGGGPERSRSLLRLGGELGRPDDLHLQTQIGFAAAGKVTTEKRKESTTRITLDGSSRLKPLLMFSAFSDVAGGCALSRRVSAG
jgi:hypothetical protein